MAQIYNLDELKNLTRCITISDLDYYIGRTRKDDKTVYDYCLKNINEKHVNAIFGYIWQYGICGVVKDLKKAFQYYDAATVNDVMCGRAKYSYHQSILDDQSINRQELTEAWWMIGISCGNPDSNYNMGENNFSRWKYLDALGYYIHAYKLYDSRGGPDMLKDKRDCVDRIIQIINNVCETTYRQQHVDKELPTIVTVMEVVMRRTEHYETLRNSVMEHIKTKNLNAVTWDSNGESNKLKDESSKLKGELEKANETVNKLKEDLTKFSNAPQSIKIIGNNTTHFTLRQLVISQSKYVDLKQLDKLTQSELKDMETLCLAQENNGTAFAVLGYIANLNKQNIQAVEYWNKGADLNNITCIRTLVQQYETGTYGHEHISMLQKGFFLGDKQCRKTLAETYPESAAFTYIEMLYDEKNRSEQSHICFVLMGLLEKHGSMIDLSYLFTHTKYNDAIKTIPDIKATIAKYICTIAEEIEKQPESGKNLFRRAIIAQFTQGKSFDDVYELYKRSAEKGYFNTEYYLGNMCYNKSDFAGAVLHYMRAMQNADRPFMASVCHAKINAICMKEEAHKMVIKTIVDIENNDKIQKTEIRMMHDNKQRLEKGVIELKENAVTQMDKIKYLEHENNTQKEEIETLRKEITKLQDRLADDIVRVNPDEEI